jgi:hypothetical protein
MNWTTLHTPTYFKQEADKILKKVKKENKGRKTKLVLVTDKPRTFKEVFID